MQKDNKSNGFQSGIGFILATAGSAIGLGNLWSFPYKTAKYGGAAFVFLYLISILLIGIVVMFAEFHIGRRSKANPITAYKNTNKKMGFFGLFAVIIPFIIVCYYMILGGYTVRYTASSFVETSINTFASKPYSVMAFTAIFVLLAVLVIMAGVKKGIENVSKVLMPALFIILIALAVYALFLGDGVKEGLDFYLNPKFDKLGFEGVLAAMSQAFYSLSLGMGIMVSYGSYAGKEVKVGKSMVMICVFDSLVALLAGLIIFPSAFHFDPNIDVTTLNGIYLMFDILPKIFSSLGSLGVVISVFFFSMVVIAALTSVISLLEVVTQFVIQRYKVRRKKAIVIVALICFILSVPITISLGKALLGENAMRIFGENYLDFFDRITNVVLMPVGALGACLSIGYFLKEQKGKQRFSSKLLNETLKSEGLDLKKFGNIFSFMVKFITPLLIIFVEIFGIIDITFPKNSQGIRAFSLNGLGTMLTALVVFVAIIVVYFLVLKNKETGYNIDEENL